MTFRVINISQEDKNVLQNG